MTAEVKRLGADTPHHRTPAEYPSRDAWIEEARCRFGDDSRLWHFVCPVCETPQSAADFEAHTDLAREKIGSYIGFSCIGRWVRGGCERKAFAPNDKAPSRAAIGCDYAGGGLFKLNPVTVHHEGQEHRLFAFAEAP